MLDKLVHVNRLRSAYVTAGFSIFFASIILSSSILLSLQVYAETETSDTSVQVESNKVESAQVESDVEKPSEPLFNIWEYDVSGVVLLDHKKIEEALVPFLGPNKSFSVVEQASKRLEELYKESGYPVIYVTIPPQDVVGGIVKIDVVEGVVSRIRVSDSDYFLLSDIKDRLPALVVGQPLDIFALQTQLDNLNSLSSDLRVTPLLKQGSEPGTVEVVLKVKDKLPVHGGIELNNYASANTSSTRLSANVSYDNLWAKQHSFSLQSQITPEEPSEIQLLTATYVLPFIKASNRLAMYLVKSNSDLSILTESGNGLLVQGNSTIGGLRYIYPSSLPSGFRQVVTLGFDYKDVEDSLGSNSGNANTPSISSGMDVSRTHFALWTTEYKGTWRSADSVTQLGIGAYFGLRKLGNSIEEFENKRYLAEPNFIYWKGSIAWDRKLPLGMQFRSTFKFQHAEAPLLSNEQFSIGGRSTVKGYYESQSMGDRGVALEFELDSPKLFKSVRFIDEFRLFTFLQGAQAEILEPLPDQVNSFDLASAGIGAHFRGLGGLSFEIVAANPLIQACNTEACNSEGDTDNSGVNAYFTTSYNF